MFELAVQFPVRLVIVDLAGVSFADARAISVLVELDRVCAAAGSMLTLRHPSAAIDRLMRLCGLDLDLDRVVDQAVSAVELQ